MPLVIARRCLRRRVQADIGAVAGDHPVPAGQGRMQPVAARLGAADDLADQRQVGIVAGAADIVTEEMQRVIVGPGTGVEQAFIK